MYLQEAGDGRRRFSAVPGRVPVPARVNVDVEIKLEGNGTVNISSMNQDLSSVDIIMCSG